MNDSFTAIPEPTVVMGCGEVRKFWIGLDWIDRRCALVSGCLAGVGIFGWKMGNGVGMNRLDSFGSHTSMHLLDPFDPSLPSSIYPIVIAIAIAIHSRVLPAAPLTHGQCHCYCLLTYLPTSRGPLLQVFKDITSHCKLLN